MSALARYFKSAGKMVAGYDRTPTQLTDSLKLEGMQIHFDDSIDAIPESFRNPHLADHTLVVLTPAIPEGHTEKEFFSVNGYRLMKRSEVLGLITANQMTYAVAGTHGKTTTSSMLAHILRSGGHNCTAFLGGISTNYNSNLVLGNSTEENHEIVVEADEFDRSFLTLYPDAAIITSMDADHLDIYGEAGEMQRSYRMFAGQVKSDGFILRKHGLDLGEISSRLLTYSITSKDSDYRAEKIEVIDGRYLFNLITPGYVIEGLTIGLPGRHNVENAVAASALALERGVDPLSLKEALKSFNGVQRRFEFRIRRDDCVFIDDYAHHPEELKAAISSARELFSGKRLTVIFQPHLYSRTRDFAVGFAESLSLADEVILLEIYPARELPIPGVDANLIFDQIKISSKSILSKENVLEFFKNKRPELLMTLGAGDIDQLVEPIQKMLQSQ